MIEVREEDGNLTVLIGSEEVEVLDAGEDYILAECSLSDLVNERSEAFPRGLRLEIHSENGFGTYFFYELHLSGAPSGVVLAFRCHTPNKYWEGQFGLAAFITAVKDQVAYHENWKATEIETEDDWKGITLERVLGFGEPLHASIQAAASDLSALLHSAEVALSGLPWKDEYDTNEDKFCRELLEPLIRRMGFVFVRYTHGSREYGKDFTFSELTPFAFYRHYGLQAKAGDISGEANSTIDQLLGQIVDAFEMPYYELGSREPRYISTFVIAISGRYTENARQKIVDKMPKGFVGSVFFLDHQSITELVERFWKTS